MAPPPNQSPSVPPEERPPLGQRFFDNILLLLALGMLIMFVVFTGWGMWEILTIPKATLP
jgi:hypothetical protein